MTDLHRNIMNLPCVGPAKPLKLGEQRSYALGHKEARHAAAELAIATQGRIEALEDALRNLDQAFMVHTQWNGEPPAEILAARAALKDSA